MKAITQILFATPLLALLALTGCKKSEEAASSDPNKITGKPSDPPVTLKAAWKPGWSYDIFLQSEQQADMGMGMGMGRMRGGPGGAGAAAAAGGRPDSSLEITLKQDLAIAATNGPKDGVNLDIELQSIGATAFMGNETIMHYDSAQGTASGQAEQVAGFLDKVVGGHLTAKLDSSGKLDKVEGVTELIEQAAGEQGDNANTDNRPNRGGGRRGMFGGMMGGNMTQRMLTDTYFRPLLEFSGLPSDGVRVGASWTNQQELNVIMLGTFLVQTTNTFRGWQMRDGHKCARVDVTGTIVQARRDTGADNGGFNLMRMFGNLSIEDPEVSGTMWVDPKIEFPVEVSVKQSFKVAGTMPTGMGFGRRGGPGGPNAGAGAAAPTAEGERFSRPVSMNLLIKLREAKAP